MSGAAHTLLISGSLRSGSTNTAVLRTALELDGVNAVLYDGMAELPHFNPDNDLEGQPVHPAVAKLRAQIAQADALLICTPEYAGAVPGSLKNLLEWTVGDGCLNGKPTAWFNGSGSPTGAADAHASLRKVLGYVDAEIVEQACRQIPVPRHAVGPEGTIVDPEIRAQIGTALTALAARAAYR